MIHIPLWCANDEISIPCSDEVYDARTRDKVDQLAALTSWDEALGMGLGWNHRKVSRICYKVEINEGMISTVRGESWQGKEVDSEEDISIVDAYCGDRGDVPSPWSTPPRVHLFSQLNWLEWVPWSDAF